MSMVRASAPWPFGPNSLGLPQPEVGDLVEVWFLPAAKVERDGVQMVRVRSTERLNLEWWVAVDSVVVEEVDDGAEEESVSVAEEGGV